MMKNRALRRVCRRIALTAMPVLLLTIVVGCPFLDFLNPPPAACDPECGEGQSCVDGECVDDAPAEAVLAGEWTITPAEPGDFADFDFQGTFNADGQLTQIMGTRAEDGATATLDTTGSTTTLAGSDVTIDIPGDVMSRVFTGTLSEDQNTMTGTVTEQINLGDLEIVLPGGDLTWTRVVDAPACDPECEEGESCVDGACVADDPCDGVECGEGESCVDGACVADDPCDGVECGEGESCVDGACVADDPCDGVECGEGESCVDGACVADDPCDGVECEEGESCEDGVCVPDGI